MGFKKIKVTDVACERYERGIDMDKIKQRADDFVRHTEDIDDVSSATIKRQAFIDGARAQRCIDNEYFRQKIKKAILWLKCRSEFPFSDSMLDSFGQFMEDK